MIHGYSEPNGRTNRHNKHITDKNVTGVLRLNKVYIRTHIGATQIIKAHGGSLNTVK